MRNPHNRKARGAILGLFLVSLATLKYQCSDSGRHSYSGLNVRYTSFQIKNFKGIRDTTVNLDTIAGANVFSLVGLNESGKTTVLEAIHSFAPDDATSELLSGEQGIGVPFSQRVPRHLISEFTGLIEVIANIEVSEEELESIKNELLYQHDIKINTDHLNGFIRISRSQKFKDGDFVTNYFSIKNKLEVRLRTHSQKSTVAASAMAERKTFGHRS